MLPLHIAFRKLISPFLVLIFTSCSYRPNTDAEIIKALNESVENSNRNLSVFTNEIMWALQEKQRDPTTSERANYWYPRAQKIQQISKEAIDYIEKIKIDFDRKSRDANNVFKIDDLALYEMLISYRKQVLQVDFNIGKAFERSISLFTQTLDSSSHHQKNLFQRFFDDVPIFNAKAMLTKLQNNITVNEQKIVEFCHEQTGKVTFGPCVVDWPIVAVSSTFVQPGEKIEIIAGIGSFYSNIEPEIFIYGKQVTLIDNSLATYKLKAETKPGKYHVPVKINYKNQDGNEVTVEKEITYTVANMEKQ